MTDNELIVEVCHDLINRAMRREGEYAEHDEGDPGRVIAQDDRDKEAAIRRLLERSINPRQSGMEAKHEQWVRDVLNWMVAQDVPMDREIPAMLRYVTDKMIAAAQREAALAKENKHNRDKWWELEQNYILPTFKWATELDPKVDLQQLVADNAGKNCVELLFEYLKDQLANLQLKDDCHNDACTPAFDEIAAMCGCPEWEYPGQVIRDVGRVIKQCQALRACVVYARDRRGGMFDFDEWNLQVQLALQGDVSPHAVENAQAKEAQAWEVIAVIRKERDDLKEEAKGLHAELKAVVDYAIDVVGMPTSTMLGPDAPSSTMRKLHVERDESLAKVAELEPWAEKARDRHKALEKSPPWFEGALLSAMVGDAKACVERKPVDVDRHRERTTNLRYDSFHEVLDELVMYRNLTSKILALAHYNEGMGKPQYIPGKHTATIAGIHRIVGVDPAAEGGDRSVEIVFQNVGGEKKVAIRGVDFDCEECNKLEGSTLDNGWYRCNSCGYPGQ